MNCFHYCECCAISTLCEERVPLEARNCVILRNQAWERKRMLQRQRQAEAPAQKGQAKSMDMIQMKEALQLMEASQRRQAEQIVADRNAAQAEAYGSGAQGARSGEGG